MTSPILLFHCYADSVVTKVRSDRRKSARGTSKAIERGGRDNKRWKGWGRASSSRAWIRSDKVMHSALGDDEDDDNDDEDELSLSQRPRCRLSPRAPSGVPPCVAAAFGTGSLASEKADLSLSRLPESRRSFAVKYTR